VSKSSIQKEKIHRPSGSHPSSQSHIREVDDVIIQVTQAYCPSGHNLVRNQTLLFDGQPGVSLWLSDGQREGEVVLSPFHGDHTKQGLEFPDGSRLEITCPECRNQLPKLQPCTCPDNGDLVVVYLTPELDDGHVVALCNIWGCFRSKVFDQAQLLAAYLED
jgi:hypothetical protein